MKFRGWLLMLLFAHVMLHPWVHAIGVSKLANSHVSISSAPANGPNTLGTSDQCELCRVGHNAAVTPKLPKVDLLNPRWIHIALQAVNCASLQADLRLPPRAPPIV